MHSLGYGGEYPYYTKKGSIKGIHTSYMSSGGGIIFPVKDAVFFVACYAFLGDDGNIYPQLYAGFAKNKDIITESDVFSCLLNDGGAVIDVIGDEEYALELGAKTAECKKLTKKEKRRVHIKKNTM